MEKMMLRWPTFNWFVVMYFWLAYAKEYRLIYIMLTVFASINLLGKVIAVLMTVPLVLYNYRIGRHFPEVIDGLLHAGLVAFAAYNELWYVAFAFAVSGVCSSILRDKAKRVRFFVERRQ